MIKLNSISLVCVLFVLAGCATISGSGSNQSISVQTFATDGSEIEGVKCDMTNDEGTWFVMTPGSTTVHKSNKDLQVVCKKSGIDIGTANVVSRTKGNMFGNIILGGGIGAIVDHNNGAAYEYPGLIKVYMGRTNQRIEEQAPTQATTPSQATTNTSTAKNSDLSLEDAKKKCIDLGFQQATEGFGNCVLKLAKQRCNTTYDFEVKSEQLK